MNLLHQLRIDQAAELLFNSRYPYGQFLHIYIFGLGTHPAVHDTKLNSLIRDIFSFRSLYFIMAPSITTLEHGPSVIPISSLKLPRKAPTQIPQESVDLSLTLCESHILEAANSQYLEYLGPELAQKLDIESILVVCWLLVLNGFSPVRTTYLEFHPQSNLCYIDGERQGIDSSALEFSSERPLKDLVRDFCLIKAGINPPDPDEGSAADGRNHFLSSAIRYAGDRPTLQEAPLSAKSKVLFTHTHVLRLSSTCIRTDLVSP